ncbi:hypothetical protein ABZ626_35590 [Streptomyces longispororuber]|uniref:hypothetical protein n=1 Tax=Streptomyces longispororuber TaxID=68230 RepID=UPI0033F58111
MSHRRAHARHRAAHARTRAGSLRAAVVASAVAAGVLGAPSAVAFASESAPKPKPTATESTPAPAPAEAQDDVAKKRAAAKEQAQRETAPRPAPPRGGVAAGDKPTAEPSAAPGTPERATVKAPRDQTAPAPRGGVAAGERPATGGDDNTVALLGSAAGIALAAGVGTMALRRRATGGVQG